MHAEAPAKRTRSYSCALISSTVIQSNGNKMFDSLLTVSSSVRRHSHSHSLNQYGNMASKHIYPEKHEILCNVQKRLEEWC